MNKSQMIAQIESNMAIKHGAYLSYRSHMRDSVSHVQSMLDTSAQIVRLVTEARAVIAQYSHDQRLYFGIWGDAPEEYIAAMDMLNEADKLENSFYRTVR